MFWYRRNPAVITQLPPQLFAVTRQSTAGDPDTSLASIGSRLGPDGLIPISNESRGPARPTGGLWTSTFLGDEQGSDWIQWADGAWGPGEWECHLLYPREANIYQIDTLEDLEELYADYRLETEIYRIMKEAISSPGAIPEYMNVEDMLGLYAAFDFEAIARDFDAIHLTRQGLSSIKRALSPRLPMIHSWDCESTLWFRWCFDRVEYLGMRIFDPTRRNPEMDDEMKTVLYATKLARKPEGWAERVFWGFYSSIFLARITHEDEVIHQVVVTPFEGPEDEALYWGWWPYEIIGGAEKQQFWFVHYAKGLVDMCFPYGAKAEEQRGRGKLMPVQVEEIRIVPPEEPDEQGRPAR